MKHYPHHISDFNNATRICKLPTVYVLTTFDFKYIKIGQSTTLKQRMGNIQSGCPFSLSLWISIKTPTPTPIEKWLHKKMEHVRLRGEWFSPKGVDLDFLVDFFATTNLHIREVQSALLQA